MRNIIFAMACGLIITGCQTSPGHTQDTGEIALKQPVLPDWVLSPPNTGELVVAIVPKQKKSPSEVFQLKAAILDARAQLARNRAMHIEDHFVTTQKRDQGGDYSYSTGQGRQLSTVNVNFSEAEVIDKYVSDNGDLYILYGFRDSQTP